MTKIRLSANYDSRTCVTTADQLLALKATRPEVLKNVDLHNLPGMNRHERRKLMKKTKVTR